MSQLTDALRAAWTAQEKDLTDTQQYDKNVCQCCGYAKTTASAIECVCDRLDWYMLPGGGIECQAHRFQRAGLRMENVPVKRKWFGARR